MPTTDEKAEIGILFIHGIGEPQRGQTLLGVGEPIVEWIGQWLDDIGHAWLDLGDDQIPERYKKLRYGKVSIKQSFLMSGSRSDPSAPPHVELELSVTGSEYVGYAEQRSS